MSRSSSTACIWSLADEGPVIDRWQTEMSGRGVFYARRNPERALARHEVLAGLTRYLVAYTSTELIRLAEEQRRIEERLNGRSLPVMCSHCPAFRVIRSG
ncbi:hypothetical protein [Streptosporangium album]|uniref:hypothetical protein n=1 Tax=Streptosporangium album TaxID=47479 RepID=UPI0031EF4720